VEATTQAPLTTRGGGGFGRSWLVGETREEDWLVGETREEDDSAVRMRGDRARSWSVGA
jgi:hypothetical protein